MGLTTKRWRWAATGLMAVSAVVVGILAWPVSLRERARRVQPGMTQAEVERVLAAQSAASELHHIGFDVRDGKPRPVPIFQWVWDEGSVTVKFGADGTVLRAEFDPNPEPPSVFDRWGRRLAW